MNTIEQYKCPTCDGELKFFDNKEYEYFSCHSCDFICDHILLNDKPVPDIIVSNNIDPEKIDLELLNKIVSFKNKMLKNKLG